MSDASKLQVAGISVRVVFLAVCFLFWLLPFAVLMKFPNGQPGRYPATSYGLGPDSTQDIPFVILQLPFLVLAALNLKRGRYWVFVGLFWFLLFTMSLFV